MGVLVGRVLCFFFFGTRETKALDVQFGVLTIYSVWSANGTWCFHEMIFLGRPKVICDVHSSNFNNTLELVFVFILGDTLKFMQAWKCETNHEPKGDPANQLGAQNNFW